MSFEIVRNRIANMTMDAVVSTADPRLMIGLGTDAMIHERVGPE